MRRNRRPHKSGFNVAGKGDGWVGGQSGQASRRDAEAWRDLAMDCIRVANPV
jgi:hypothetical protein